jgi:hypothetical protein
VSTRLSILLLADDQKGHPNTIHDHIQAFRRYSRHRVELFNPRGIADSRLLDLAAFDVIVIHYSIVVIWDDYLSPQLRERIAAFDGLKVQFLQDEYRWVDAITAQMRSLGIDVLFSVVPESQQSAIYGSRLPSTEILPTLTGYVPNSLVGRRVPPAAARPIDVGYRGRSLPFWLGRLGFEKVEIGRGFVARAAATDLHCDIAWIEGARIHGERWNQFVASCRTMLASESGSSLVDFDGTIERAVREYVAGHPTATYPEVEREVLGQFEGGPIINTASPRIFEAAALRTGMIMFPGAYSGIVEPWRHYIPLEKDFSNFEEVAERIRDVRFVEEIAESAYDELISSGRYSEREWISRFDDALAARTTARGRLRRYPRRLLALEQLAAGRSYHVSSVYWLARDLILGYLGSREALRHRALRRLLFRTRRRPSSSATSLWDDVFRLAMLVSIHTRALEPASEPFDVVAAFDEERARLTFTSRPREAFQPPSSTIGEVENAIQGRRLREIVWNHAAVGQYITLPVPPLPKRISFDVGRYDAYGVYRFDALVALAQREPTVVAEAVRPLLTARPPDDAAYRSRPEANPRETDEAET